MRVKRIKYLLLYLFTRFIFHHSGARHTLDDQFRRLHGGSGQGFYLVAVGRQNRRVKDGVVEIGFQTED